MPEPTLYFYSQREPFGEFSNFSPYEVKIDGVRWPTTEHYFQAQKFEDAAYRDEIRAASDPKRAADLGRSRAYPLRPDWEQAKDEVMRKAVRRKFETHLALRDLLLSTGERPIVENAPGDYYWGCGKDGTGQNRLGQILEQIRAELQAAAL